MTEIILQYLYGSPLLIFFKVLSSLNLMSKTNLDQQIFFLLIKKKIIQIIMFFFFNLKILK